MFGWGSCSIFISVLSIAYDIEKTRFSSGRQALFPACTAVSDPISLSGLLKSCMRTCISESKYCRAHYGFLYAKKGLLGH